MQPVKVHSASELPQKDGYRHSQEAGSGVVVEVVGPAVVGQAQGSGVVVLVVVEVLLVELVLLVVVVVVVQGSPSIDQVLLAALQIHLHRPSQPLDGSAVVVEVVEASALLDVPSRSMAHFVPRPLSAQRISAVPSLLLSSIVRSPARGVTRVWARLMTFNLATARPVMITGITAQRGCGAAATIPHLRRWASSSGTTAVKRSPLTKTSTTPASEGSTGGASSPTI